MGLEIEVRCLRYRLKRQGMLELDAWLSALDAALMSDNEELISAVNIVLSYEVPELLAMMHGETPVPDILKTYLRIPS